VTDPNDDLAERVTALEHQVREIRIDAAAARVLAGAADRDVSEFKQILQGHTRTLNALRETQVELRETQVEQGDRLTRLEDDVASMKREMREGFSTMNVGMAQITALLRNIETQGNQSDQS
jgi:DNA-binding ferritin-like protein